jgi:hypothetical protein
LISKIHLKIDEGDEFALCMVVPERYRLVSHVPKFDEKLRASLCQVCLQASVPRVVSKRSTSV